jgi:hypothetical protein
VAKAPPPEIAELAEAKAFRRIDGLSITQNGDGTKRVGIGALLLCIWKI